MCCKKVMATEFVRGYKEEGQEKLTEPVVHPEIRDDIPDQQIGESVVLSDEVQGTQGDGETQIAEPDEVLVLLLI